MIRDPFYEDILKALSRHDLDTERFEACAADLLRKSYPTLAPIPGGNDTGMDGAIADGEGPAFGLVTTTQADVIGNLRNSLKSYKRKGGVRRLVVSATSQKLTPRRRRNLEKLAEKEGFTLIQIYERQGLANLLYHSPRWCHELLNLTGEPPPLTMIPHTDRPLIDEHLIGRDDDLKWLQQTFGDCLLVGQPGSGKTYLLYRFAKLGGGLFVATRDVAAVAAGIRSQQPRALLVDDAHTKQDTLRELRALRQEMGGTFRIIADCWPGERDGVRISLGISSAAIRDLELLTRDQIVAVIKRAGVHGPRGLVRELVDQSSGKPGLAVTLTKLCLQGEVQDVALGTALIRDVRLTFEPMVGREAIELLAGFAVGGDKGMRLQAVADEMRSPLPRVKDIMTRLAAGGVIMETDAGRGLVVWPPQLRYALVRDTFFCGGTSLPIDGLLAHAQGFEQATLTLIGACHCGAKIPQTMLIDRLERITTAEAWREFASLGEADSRWAIDDHPEQFNAVVHPALHFVPERTIPMLLQRAVSDRRALNSQTDHPLRILHDWVCAAHPGTPEVLRRRRLILGATIKWFRSGSDVATGLRAIELVFSPNYQSEEWSPGSGWSVELVRGFITIEEVKELYILWRDAVSAFTGLQINDYMPLISSVRSLVYPYAMNAKLHEEHRDEMRKLAGRMLIDIATIARDRPGVLAWARHMAKEAGQNLSVHVPDDYLTLSPIRERQDWRKAEEEQSVAARSLAARWATDEPSAVAERIVYLEAEAAAAGVAVPQWTYFICTEIAAVTTSRLLWVLALMNCCARPEILTPFMTSAVNAGEADLHRVTHQCLAEKRYRAIGAEAVLMTPEPPIDLLEAVMTLLPELSHLVDVWCLRGQVAQEHLRRLLTHPDARVAVSAATGIFHSGKPINEALKAHWRRAVVMCGADHANFHEVFENDPELAFEWLANRIKEQSDELWKDLHHVEWAISALSCELRYRLIDLLPGRHILHEFVEQLVGDDPAAYARLLAKKDLHWLHIALLERRPRAGWTDKLIAALDAGYTTEEIADQLSMQGRSWGGSEEAMWQEWIDDLKPVLAHSDPRVQDVARRMIDHAETRKQQAKRRERDRAVFGRW